MNCCDNKILISLVVVCYGCSIGAYAGAQWNKFLQQPSDDSLVELEEKISVRTQHCNWGDAENRNVVSIEAGQQLFKLIGEGNEFSFRAGLLVAGCLDGGELEDFHRSAGLFFDAQPLQFLKIVKEEAVSESEMKYMLTMLPLDAVDNIDRAMNVVDDRLAVLEVVSDGQFEGIGKAGLSFLKEQKEALHRVKTEMVKADNESVK